MTPSKETPLSEKKLRNRIEDNKLGIGDIVYKQEDVRDAVRKSIKEIKEEPSIVNENDLQNMGCIELSFSGELIPVEIVEGILIKNFGQELCSEDDYSQESPRAEKLDEMPDYETTNGVATANRMQTTKDNLSFHPDGSPKDTQNLCANCGHCYDIHSKLGCFCQDCDCREFSGGKE